MLASLGARSGGKKLDILIRSPTGTASPCSYAGAGGVTTAIRKDGTFSATVPLAKAADTVKAGTVVVKGCSR